MRTPLLFLSTCAAAALAPLLPEPATGGPGAAGFPGWPESFEGRALTRLPLTAMEERFEAEGLLGRVARFTDGERIIGLRWVDCATRHVHSVAHCYRSAGLAVTTLPPVDDPDGRSWSRHLVIKGADRIELRESLRDVDGRSWPDISSWWWDSLFNRTPGPWWAVAVVRSAR